MSKPKTYREQENLRCQTKIDELLKELPEFVSLYAVAATRTHSRKTMVSYLTRQKAFFAYLVGVSGDFYGRDIKSLNTSDLERLSLDQVNLFLKHVYDHQVDNPDAANKNNTVEIYISALNALFSYLFNNQYISKNVIAKVERRHEKISHPLYLEGDENQTFYDRILSGDGLTEKQTRVRDKQGSGYRDYLICRILGTTGIRVSELVGLNIEDIDPDKTRFRVIRKGNKPQDIYFSDKIREEIAEYLDCVRPSFVTEQAERALFLVAQGKYKGQRLSVKTVENIVKKYAQAQGLSEGYRFSPHKLRHTYAMNVLRKTGNLRLTQQLMGHENIETTTIYSRMLEADLQQARSLGEN